MHIRKAVGTSAACGIPIALGGAITFAFIGWGHPALPPGTAGFVYWPAVLPVALLSLLAAPLGVHLAHRIDSLPLRRAFAILILCIGWFDLFVSAVRSGPFLYRGIDPVALYLGPVAVHWYGIMYVLAFFLCWRLVLARSRRPDSPLSNPQQAGTWCSTEL